MDEINFINERDVSVADILHTYADYDVRSHESPPAVDLYAGAFLGKPLPDNDFEVQEIARALCIYVEKFLLKELHFDYFSVNEDKHLQRYVWGRAFAEAAKRFGLEKLFDSPHLDLTQAPLANLRRYFADAYYFLFGAEALLLHHSERVPRDWLAASFPAEQRECAFAAGLCAEDIFLADSVVDELLLLGNDDYVKKFLSQIDFDDHDWLRGRLTQYPVSKELHKFLEAKGVSPKKLIESKEWTRTNWIFGERNPQERLMFYQELVCCGDTYCGYEVTKDTLLYLANIFGAHLIDLSKSEDEDISEAALKTLKRVSKKLKSGYLSPDAIIPALAGIKPNKHMLKWTPPCQAYASATGDYEVLQPFLDDARAREESFSEMVEFEPLDLLRPSFLVDMWGKYLVSKIDPIRSHGLENKYYNKYIQEFYDGDGALTVAELYERLKREGKPCEKKQKPWAKDWIVRIKELLKKWMHIRK